MSLFHFPPQEALCEMNDELMESTKEQELELREELDLANARAEEAHRRKDALQESLADYEITINKFRALVTQLQVRVWPPCCFCLHLDYSCLRLLCLPQMLF